ncbi:uncharacterized protein K460DRAFT_59121 [Cucurbitaria berberidis CBS 394.84]|uniref:Uncharacterized protein n=1 Tax=Cucurbitaria berberidis CBS 394.84 TaxID=1168544 RepID=A0A9P4GLF2_9PLEO|nr:uncharacterized protein K460DRAFT_59121 [Cucurbitaria berberidis CBS 394.84]KAF1847501.1 hypothetical protein K460DRAFT_59121 [Cucurbitaria berberidis CBS 394.84]
MGERAKYSGSSSINGGRGREMEEGAGCAGAEETCERWWWWWKMSEQRAPKHWPGPRDTLGRRISVCSQGKEVTDYGQSICDMYNKLVWFNLLLVLFKVPCSHGVMLLPRHYTAKVRLLCIPHSGALPFASCERRPEWLSLAKGSECPHFLKHRGASTKSVTSSPESDVDTLFSSVLYCPVSRPDWLVAAKLGFWCSRPSCTERCMGTLLSFYYSCEPRSNILFQQSPSTYYQPKSVPTIYTPGARALSTVRCMDTVSQKETTAGRDDGHMLDAITPVV